MFLEDGEGRVGELSRHCSHLPPLQDPNPSTQLRAPLLPHPAGGSAWGSSRLGVESWGGDQIQVVCALHLVKASQALCPFSRCRPVLWGAELVGGQVPVSCKHPTLCRVAGFPS